MGKIGLGEQAAKLHRGGPKNGGLSWNEVAATLKVSRTKVRAAARRYLKQHGLQCYGQPKSDCDSGLTIKEDGNYLDVQYTPLGRPRITTYDQLIEFAQVDLAQWVREKFEVTSWEVGFKDEHTSLEYQDGKGTGSILKDGLKVEQLFRVFARFARRRPEPVNPTIQPVQAQTRYEFPQPRLLDRPFERSLLWGDPQVGFFRNGPTSLEPLHDRRALSIVLQLAEKLQPDRIDILGDLFDLADASRFVNSPDFQFLIQPAINELHWFLAQLRAACPEAKITAHEGNHDKRLRRAVSQHIPWAYALQRPTAYSLPPALSIPGLLDLHNLGILWAGNYPDDEDWFGNIRIFHGDIVRRNPGDTAKTVLLASDCSTVFGHIHRRELVYRTIYSQQPREVFAFSPGCTCRVDGRVPGSKKQENWQQGCAVLDVYQDNEIDPQPVIIAIQDGKASYNGQLYEGTGWVPDGVLGLG